MEWKMRITVAFTALLLSTTASFASGAMGDCRLPEYQALRAEFSLRGRG